MLRAHISESLILFAEFLCPVFMIQEQKSPDPIIFFNPAAEQIPLTLQSRSFTVYLKNSFRYSTPVSRPEAGSSLIKQAARIL